MTPVTSLFVKNEKKLGILDIMPISIVLHQNRKNQSITNENLGGVATAPLYVRVIRISPNVRGLNVS